MKRMIPVALFGVVCFLAGYMFSPRARVAAQGQAAQGPAAPAPLAAPGPPSTRVVNGKGMYYSIDEIKKRFPPADAHGDFPSGDQGAANHLAWAPEYRFTLMRRQYSDPPRKNPNTGEMEHYVGSEMHENKTQIYIMVSGAGQVALGGKPSMDRQSPDGQHSGGALTGATNYRVKAGDFIVIPPYTWHQALPDPGQTLTYAMCHIETRNLIP
jgi:mannose-6-phosphate isomerase-like protein (cupin superfamily)